MINYPIYDYVFLETHICALNFTAMNTVGFFNYFSLEYLNWLVFITFTHLYTFDKHI